MSAPDATAVAQLQEGYFGLAFLALLDFDGDPLRVTTARTSITPSGTGDANLDSQTFSAVDPAIASVTPVHNSEGGGETLTFVLSGIVGVDTDILALIGDPSTWRGREAFLWGIVYDESGAQQGNIFEVFYGRMSAVQFAGSPDSQTIQLDCERFLASRKSASNRTYLDQADFDPDDNTAALKIGNANGATKGVQTAASAISGGYYVPGVGNVPFYGFPF